MHAGLLDVLHDRGDEGFAPVAERVDVDLDRAFEEAVDQHAPADLGGRRHRLGVVTDLHVPPAEHVRGPDEHRVADRLGDVGRLAGALGHRPRRDVDLELLAERPEPLAILGEIDRLERRPEDPPAFCFDFARKF